MRRYSPDVVLMLGEYASGGGIKLERIAVNLMDAIHPDCDGLLPDAESIDMSLPAAYFSALPRMQSIYRQLRQASQDYSGT